MILSRPDIPPPELVPVGYQPAILINYFDLGYHVDFVGEPPRRRLAIVWELWALKADRSHFSVAKEYTASLADTANLRALLETWRASPLTPAELKAFDFDAVRRKPCTLYLERKPKRSGRGSYAEVVSVLRQRKSDPVWEATISDDYMPEWVARRIAEALPPDVVQELLGTEAPESNWVEESPF